MSSVYREARSLRFQSLQLNLAFMYFARNNFVYHLNNLMKSDDRPPSNPPHEKEFTIIVNAREKTVPQRELTFDEIVILAFGPPNSDASVYTVTYQKGPDKHEKGTLVQGQSVKLKDGMIFNVVRTDKS